MLVAYCTTNFSAVILRLCLVVCFWFVLPGVAFDLNACGEQVVCTWYLYGGQLWGRVLGRWWPQRAPGACCPCTLVIQLTVSVVGG